jgi:type VI secretion system protein ImpE
MSRRTEWIEIGPQQYRGLGQRVLATPADEQGLLQLRDLVLQPVPHGADAG